MSESSKGTRITLLMRVASSTESTHQIVNDSEAWTEFVNLYSPLILSWCRQLGLSVDQAQDAKQEVFVKLLRVMQDFSYDPARGSFRNWLRRVTSNLVRDIQRASKPGNLGSGDTKIQQLLANVCDVKDADQLGDLIQKRYEEELIELASAKVQQRVEPIKWQAYQLYAVQQNEARQVADQLSIPIADVYVAKSRITKMMREEISRLE